MDKKQREEILRWIDQWSKLESPPHMAIKIFSEAIEKDIEKEEQKRHIIEMMEMDEKLGLYKQTTAVQWIISKFLSYKPGQMSRRQFIEDCDKAIEMEKEQIVNANDVGFEEGHKHTKSNYTFFPKDGLQYYNETYGKK